MDFFSEYGTMLLIATGQTLLMTGISVVASYLLGAPLGILAFITAPTSITPHKNLYTVLDWAINLTRSVPFIILMFAIVPFTQLLVGTTIGPKGAIVPLTVAAIPFVARMVQSALGEVDKGIIESTKAMGATNFQIVTRALLPECLPSLLSGMSITSITLLGYTAMAGTVGGGGLGDVAIRYGYYRYQPNVMFACMVVLVLVVQLIQFGFDRLVKKIDKNV
ncbi:MAG: methionine ABC transporter permease [Angelakisella sp.]